jgi:hypothetical protein
MAGGAVQRISPLVRFLAGEEERKKGDVREGKERCGPGIKRGGGAHARGVGAVVELGRTMLTSLPCQKMTKKEETRSPIAERYAGQGGRERV